MVEEVSMDMKYEAILNEILGEATLRDGKQVGEALSPNILREFVEVLIPLARKFWEKGFLRGAGEFKLRRILQQGGMDSPMRFVIQATSVLSQVDDILSFEIGGADVGDEEDADIEDAELA